MGKFKYCAKYLEGRGDYLTKHKFQDCSERIREEEAAAKRKKADGAGLQLISKFAKPQQPFDQNVANE